MLFHIKQSQAPADCPYGAGGSRSLFDGDHHDVTIRGYWLAFPQHTTYLVVETEDIAHLQAFLKPGAGVTLCEITPVSDVPGRRQQLAPLNVSAKARTFRHGRAHPLLGVSTCFSAQHAALYTCVYLGGVQRRAELSRRSRQSRVGYFRPQAARVRDPAPAGGTPGSNAALA